MLVQPGRTTQVSLGGSGCAIVGKIDPDAITNGIDWQRDVQNLSTKTFRPPAPKREDFSSDPEFLAAQKDWSAQEREFWLSESGRELQRNSHQYVPRFAMDGSFRIDDVLPGTYQLTIHISDPSVADAPFSGKFLGTLEQEITVPETGAGTEQSPLDLGKLELKSSPE